MSDYDIHSCGYYCHRPACIEAQRNELRDKLFEIRTSERSIQTSDRQAAESSRSWVGLTDDEKKAIYEKADAENWHDQPLLEAVEALLKEKNA
jgi:hypothetical protein